MVTNFWRVEQLMFFCKQHNIELSIVDAGVNYDFPTNTKLISNKIAMGTQSFYKDLQ
jgi:nicotinate-nucleotide--dimethylbenzimidazole phosphoribosyltransferase